MDERLPLRRGRKVKGGDGDRKREREKKAGQNRQSSHATHLTRAQTELPLFACYYGDTHTTEGLGYCFLVGLLKVSAAAKPGEEGVVERLGVGVDGRLPGREPGRAGVAGRLVGAGRRR